MLLRDIQIQFKQAILKREDVDPRMRVYQNNVRSTFSENLKRIYPTIEKLVGEEFFLATAHAYINCTPSISGDLSTFGASFSEFLMDFPPAQSLPYLPEVAQLEYTCHEVFHEKNCSYLDILALQSIAEENYAKIKFKLHSASRLLAFQFPIVDIWQLCQSEEKQVSLDRGGENLLVIRRNLEIMFEKLENSEFAFLSAIKEGLPFEIACKVALLADPKCPIESYLQTHIVRGTITGFSL